MPSIFCFVTGRLTSGNIEHSSGQQPFLKSLRHHREAWHRKLTATIRRPADWDFLGLRFLRGDFDELGLFARLKIDCIKTGVWIGFALLFLAFVPILWERTWLSFNMWKLRKLLVAVLGGASLFGLFFYFCMALPLGWWWVRRRRRLDTLLLEQARKPGS